MAISIIFLLFTKVLQCPFFIICKEEILHSQNAGRHYAPDLQIEPIHLDLHITPDLESQTLNGKIYHRVRVNVDGAFFFRGCL